MHGPGKAGDEAAIKELLVSREREDRVAGLERLDEAYRKSTSRYVRGANPGLTAEDVADIWAKTLAATWKNVESGTFEFDGRLDAYLRVIARNKAVELFRRGLRLQIETGLDVDLVTDTESYSLDELLEEIETAYDKLPEGQQLVMRIDVYLYLAAGGKWVSLDRLTSEINRQSGLALHRSTVKSRRARGRDNLRRLLKKRGYLE